MTRWFFVGAMAAALPGCQADAAPELDLTRGAAEGELNAPNAFAAQAAAAVDPLVVATNQGLIRGKIDKGVPSYLGIPFAKPPVGEGRFRAPEPLDEPWQGVRDATEYGSACL